ncbi:MAG: ABC transporter permease [Myxococcaceae bacterium]|nr:ABC transporter permease [Myxococcaceae bacterium]
MSGLVLSLLDTVLDAAPALIFAAVGATLSERAGVVNVGVEGMMRAGAFAAAAAALVMPTPLGVVVGVAAGALVGALHGGLCIFARSDQVVSGMAINLVMLALGQFLLEAVFSSPSGTPPITQLPRWLGHSPLTWLAVVTPLVVHGLVERTAWGLRLRAVGEKPEAVAAMGVRVSRLRLGAVMASGALAGLGGAHLSTAVLDRFEHHMPAGLGFMAVAAMVFGRWTPLGAALAALFFAFGNALRLSLASSFPGLVEVVPQGVLLALPYALTLLVLTLQRPGLARAPAALGRPYDPELR